MTKLKIGYIQKIGGEPNELSEISGNDSSIDISSSSLSSVISNSNNMVF